MKFFTFLLLCMFLSSCIMLDSQKVDSRNETSIDNSLPPVSSGTVVAKKINFNSNRVVDLSPILDQYPDMERLTIVSKGVSGVSMTKEEAQNMGKVTIGGPGVRGYYTFVVFLSDGSEIQGRL